MTASRPLRRFFLGDLQCRSSSGRGGHAHQNALVAAQILRHGVRPLRRHLDILIGQIWVVDLRHDCRCHVLQSLKAVEGRVRLHGDALNLRVQLFQSASGPHKSSGGPQGRDKVRHLSFGLLPDFVAGCPVVRAPVFVVRVLICVEIPIRLCRDHLPRLANGPVGPIRRVGPDNLRAIRFEVALSLLGDVRRHAQCHRKSHRRAQHGIGDSRIAACRIEKALRFAEEPAALRVSHNGRRRTVLYGSSGIVHSALPRI